MKIHEWIRHYGEFYQLDMEMSFVEQEDVFKEMEPLMIELTEKFSEKKIINSDQRWQIHTDSV